MLCFRKFPAAEKFVDKRKGGSRFSVEKILSQSTEKLRWEPFCAVLHKFPVAKKFMDERVG